MEENKRYVRLGVFVFLTLVVTAALLFILGGRSLFESTFMFETYFDESVAGLDIGAPVQFRGVPLGHVTEILTSSAAYEDNVPIDKRRAYIVVRVKIAGSKAQVKEWREDAAELAKLGFRVQTQLAGITGQLNLALDRLDPRTHPPLPFDWQPKYFYLPSAPSLAGEIMANAQQFLAHLNESNIKELVDNVDKLTVSLNKKVDELQVAKLSADTSALLTNSRATIDRLRVILEKPEIDATLHNLDSASRQLDRVLGDPALAQTVKSMDDLAQRLDAVVGDNQYDMHAIVRALHATADNLRTLSETLKRYPAGALIGGPPEKLQLPGTSQ
jgi:ABC-type transporter Mla subunit MlaD